VPELTADPTLRNPGGTKYKHIMGRKLALVVAVWILGRVAVLMAGVLPIWLVALVNIAFLPMLILWTGPIYGPSGSESTARSPCSCPLCGWCRSLSTWDGLRFRYPISGMKIWQCAVLMQRYMCF